MDASTLQLIILPAGLIAVLFAFYLARDVLARDTGTPEMQAVAGTIFEGAVAFIKRQYTTISILAVVGAVLIGALIAWVETPEVADVPSMAGLPIGIMTGIAFLVGAICSMLSGFIGMYIAVAANVRTASAAQRSLKDAIPVALRGGAVSGFLVVALSPPRRVRHLHGLRHVLGDVTVAQAPFLIVGFGFGASSWRCSPSSAAVSTPRPPTSAPTSSARSRPVSPRTTRATRPWSPTSSVTTSATAPAVAPTCSSRPPPRTSAR